MHKNLSIEKRRIIVDIGDLDGERADTFQTGFTLIGGFHSDGDEFSVVTFSVKHLVGGHFASFLVHCEFGAFLVGLLDD